MTASVGFVSSANAATTVTFFSEDGLDDQGAEAPFNVFNDEGVGVVRSTTGSTLSIGSTNFIGFYSPGDDFAENPGYVTELTYRVAGSLFNGATIGDQNFSRISLTPGVLDAVAQFNLDGVGGGGVVAIVSNDDGSALSLSQGIDAIEAASVPEPSGLSLLAFGAAGLVTRRNRKQVA